MNDLTISSRRFQRIPERLATALMVRCPTCSQRCFAIAAAVRSILIIAGIVSGLACSFSGIAQPSSGSRFQLVEGSYTWETAKVDAEQRGGHLATITSAADNSAVSQLVAGKVGEFLIGATDLDSEGNWQWITGEPWTYSNWGDGEPNNAGDEDCAAIRADGHWNDATISGERNGYVLEIPSPRTAAATSQVVNGFVVGITVVDGGYGYTNAPLVTITGGGGNGATATATIQGRMVTKITITNPGSDYTSTPNVSIAPPPFPPRRATAIAEVVNGFVVGAVVTDGGFGYDTPPAVLLFGGGGSGASAIATVADGVVTAISISNPGNGYAAVPKLSIASPPFSPEVGIEVSRIRVRLKVVLGRRYLLEASTDLNTWTSTGPSFIAEDEALVQEFDVDTTGRYFRITQQP